MNYYNKDKIKNSLTINQVEELVSELGGEPQNRGNYLICKTICHNAIGHGSYKLYYYNNTKLFRCYTECENSVFDIFELVCKVKNNAHEIKYSYSTGEPIAREWILPDGVEYVAAYFGFEAESNEAISTAALVDWQFLNEYKNRILEKEEKKIEFHIFDDSILNYLPQPRIIPWEKEHISPQVIKSHKICYDPCYNGIVIPHYDIQNRLIGIRERTLTQAYEKNGKYRPAILNRVMYNHPLGFNLYNLNNSKENISLIKKAVIFESEKSTLLFASYFGENQDISVACCGSNIIAHQIQLLLSLGVKEVIVAFDRQYKETGSEEWRRWTKKLTTIHEKYGSQVQISYIFDKENRLEYKASPIDQGKDLFLELFKERFYL